MFLGVAKLYYGTGKIYGQDVVGDMVVFSSLSFLQLPWRRKGFKPSAKSKRGRRRL